MTGTRSVASVSACILTMVLGFNALTATADSVSGSPHTTQAPTTTDAVQIPRILDVLTASGSAGTPVVVGVDLINDGGEDGISFTLDFDESKLSFVSVALGPDAAAAGFAAPPTTNTIKLMSNGYIGVVIDCLANPPGVTCLTADPPSNKRILNFTFSILAGAPAGFTPLTVFVNASQANSETPFSVSDTQVDVTADTNIDNGGVTILGFTAADITISGRVKTAAGQGIRNTTVYLIDSEGKRITAMTNSAGYYTFENVESGATYIIGVTSRRYKFGRKVLEISDNISGLDFIDSDQ